VVDVTSFHVDPENQVGLKLLVKDEVFAGPGYPNWIAVSVSWLSGFQFEITPIARIPAAG
jgi:enamine deaminase RidA (YjgF/YER057c/UK114 family)